MTFESEKNTRAAIYTFVICLIILLIAILYKWRLTIPPVITAQDLIEVNLGNDKEGLGDKQPLVKGEAARETRESNKEANKARTVASTAKTIEADEKDNDAAPVERASKNNKNANSTVTNPAPQKPKVPLYKGAVGSGGNNPTTDNGFRNEGYKKGNGDAGSPGGKPDSYGNTPGGKSGISVVRGLSNRKPIHFPSMEDEFNESAKVYVDIVVDESGRVTNASIAKGTTTSSGTLRSIAIQKAKQLKFPASTADVETGTILFNFILRS